MSETKDGRQLIRHNKGIQRKNGKQLGEINSIMEDVLRTYNLNVKWPTGKERENILIDSRK